MLLEKCLECFNHEFNACEGCRDKEYHLDFIQSTEQDLKDYLKMSVISLLIILLTKNLMKIYLEKFV